MHAEAASWPEGTCLEAAASLPPCRNRALAALDRAALVLPDDPVVTFIRFKVRQARRPARMQTVSPHLCLLR